jgi:hypothetical protein
LGADVTWTDERSTAFESNPRTVYMRLEPYTVVNARAGMNFPSWTLSLIVRNALNDDTLMGLNGVTDIGYLRNSPALYSLQLSASF